MKTPKFIFITILCTFSCSFSQNVIATSGNCFSTENGSISWTLGDVFISTYINNSFVLLQGFHQPWDAVSENMDNIESCFADGIKVFPNPVSDHTIVQTDRFEGLYYVLYNFEGRVLQEKVFQSDRTLINFSNLPPSLYFLKIVNMDKELKIFKIIKK